MKLIHYPTYVQCPVCKKPFKTDLYLRRHIMSSHEGLNRGHPKPNGTSENKNFLNVNMKNAGLNAAGVDIKYELRSAS
jgi:uncharacterized C2H2 Zn-finger protein